jgi:hypothetical protein
MQEGERQRIVAVGVMPRGAAVQPASEVNEASLPFPRLFSAEYFSNGRLYFKHIRCVVQSHLK